MRDVERRRLRKLTVYEERGKSNGKWRRRKMEGRKERKSRGREAKGWVEKGYGGKR